MAHGYLSATDIRSNPNYLGAIASAIGSKIKKSSDMAAKERAYASKQAEKGGTSLEEAGIGKGYFFKRALGSSFGGDRIARTRGRFETDPGPGRDPSGTQASRFRGGFDYGVSNTIKPPTGGALASIVSAATDSSGPGGPGGFLGAGAQAINPEVLGGELAKYQGTRKNAAGFSVDTTATEVKDLAGILNQIGQLIVRTSNSTIQAVDGVQRVNVKVVESVQSLGQLQVAIAERALDQQRMLAGAAEDHQEKMLARQLSAAEKGEFTPDDFSNYLTPEKGYGFGGKGGGILGGLFGGSGIGDILGTGLNLFGGGRRGGVRTNRFGVKTKTDAGGFNFRYKGREFASGTGDTLTNARIAKGGAFNPVKAENDIMQRYTKRYGERAAVKRFGAEALGDAGVKLGKSGVLSRFLRPIFKRIPIFGGLIDFAVSLALGEPVGRAAAKAVGATLGAGLGSLIPVPGVGTIAGGILGDFAGGAIYDAVAGGGGSAEGVTPFATGGIVTKPTTGLVGEAGAEGVFPLEGRRGKDTFVKFGEGILEAQRRNKHKYAKIQALGMEEYYDKQNGWQKFLNIIKGLGGQLGKWIFGDGERDAENDPLVTGLADASSNVSPETTSQFASVLPEGRPVLNDKFLDRGGTHMGIDVGVDAGSRVTAVEAGVVEDIYPNYGGHGDAVVVKHADGTKNIYGHVDPTVAVGDEVKVGDVIARVKYWPGGKGNDDNTHLHMERVGTSGTKVDPAAYLNKEALKRAKADNEKIAAKNKVKDFAQSTAESKSMLTDASTAGKEGKVKIPNVGTIQRGRNWFGQPQTKFYDLNGNEISEASFRERFAAEKAKIEKLKQDLPNEDIPPSSQSNITPQQVSPTPEGVTLEPVSSSSSSPDVLQASAIVSAGEREAAMRTPFIQVPAQQPTQGSGNSTLMASSLSGPSASEMTPGWLLNSVLS